jgi:hypothetical protein
LGYKEIRCSAQAAQPATRRAQEGSGLIMSHSNEDKPKNERFLDALVEELRTMSDTDALEGENAESLVKLGESLLKGARDKAGALRMADAKRKLSVASVGSLHTVTCTASEARMYLASLPKLTLAARGLNELSDEDVLDLYRQAKSLEDAPPPILAKDKKE